MNIDSYEEKAKNFSFDENAIGSMPISQTGIDDDETAAHSVKKMVEDQNSEAGKWLGPIQDRPARRDPSFLSEEKTGSRKSHTSNFSIGSLDRTDFNPSSPYPDVLRILQVTNDSNELAQALKDYEAKTGYVDMKRLKRSNRTKLRKYNDAIYFGEIFNEKRHGMGILIHKSGNLYEGEFENDHKHGKGFEITAKGCRYEGSFSNGKPEGYGVFVWSTGEVYEGEWKCGLKHGSGFWKGIKGENYMGEWRCGKQEGHGVFVWKNGDRYEGEFKDFLKHGHGTEKFANGDYYVGNYRNGKPHGFGEYFWANGSQYKGFFRNGLRHGKGTWKNGPGKSDEYDGEWFNDKKCGYGVFKWISGNYYEGEFFDDNRQGQGKMHWVDGSYYKGTWQKGIQHGEGSLHIPGKEPRIGLFENNVYIGQPNNDENLDEEVKKKEPIRLPPRQDYHRKMLIDTPQADTPKTLVSTNKSSLRGSIPVETPKRPTKLIISDKNTPRRVDRLSIGKLKMEKVRSTINSETPKPRSESVTRTIKSDRDYGSLSSDRNQVTRNRSISKNNNQSFDKPIERSRDRSVDRSIDRSIDRSRNQSWMNDSSILSRKKNSLPLSSKGMKNIKLTPLKQIQEVDSEAGIKPRNCLLTQKEHSRWVSMKARLNINIKKYSDLSKPEICFRIRQLINPPAWKPAGTQKTLHGKSELNGTPANNNSPWCIIYPL